MARQHVIWGSGGVLNSRSLLSAFYYVFLSPLYLNRIQEVYASLTSEKLLQCPTFHIIIMLMMFIKVTVIPRYLSGGNPGHYGFACQGKKDYHRDLLARVRRSGTAIAAHHHCTPPLHTKSLRLSSDYQDTVQYSTV